LSLERFIFPKIISSAKNEDSFHEFSLQYPSLIDILSTKSGSSESINVDPVGIDLERCPSGLRSSLGKAV
jgi:hypothetical protein